MTDTATIRAVIRYLGLAALVLILGEIWLVRDLIRQGAGAGQVDPAAVGAVLGIGTLAGTAIGALGSLLVSTRSSETPTPVVGEGGGPVKVDEVKAERGASDLAIIVAALVIAVALVLVFGTEVR
jgi:flagellar biogenesis protein FliO